MLQLLDFRFIRNRTAFTAITHVFWVLNTPKCVCVSPNPLAKFRGHIEAGARELKGKEGRGKERK